MYLFICLFVSLFSIIRWLVERRRSFYVQNGKDGFYHSVAVIFICSFLFNYNHCLTLIIMIKLL
jgi:hypothetical protein